jgi:hypothetical protein
VSSIGGGGGVVVGLLVVAVRLMSEPEVAKVELELVRIRLDMSWGASELSSCRGAVMNELLLVGCRVEEDDDGDGMVGVCVCGRRRRRRRAERWGLICIWSRGRRPREDHQAQVMQPTTIPQAGGHQDQVSINSAQPDKIIKKTNTNELEFYQQLVNQLEEHHHHHPKPDWRPHFFGPTNHHQTTAKQQDEHVFILLENLTYKRSTIQIDQLFIHPNVIDIKLGQRLYDDRATPEKQERMNRAALETTSAKFGIRLTGAQVCVCVCVCV